MAYTKINLKLIIHLNVITKFLEKNTGKIFLCSLGRQSSLEKNLNITLKTPALKMAFLRKCKGKPQPGRT